MRLLQPISAVLILFALLAPVWAMASALDGKWNFVLQTEGGERRAPADLKVDGTDVTGKWGGADVKGTFTEGKLELKFAFNSEEAGPGTLEMKGALDGDKIKGNWKFEQYTGTFEATRPAE